MKNNPTPADVREALGLKQPILPYLVNKFKDRIQEGESLQGRLTIDKMLRIIREDKELTNAFNEALLVRYGKKGITKRK